MDAIGFSVRNDLERRWTVVDILVNGKALIEHVLEVERPAAEASREPTLAGAYMSIPFFQVYPPSLYFMGRKSIDGRSSFLACGDCGESGCWPLRAEILVSEEAVTWKNFDQPYRKHWDLSKLGPFTFDRKGYEAALAPLDEP